MQSKVMKEVKGVMLYFEKFTNEGFEYCQKSFCIRYEYKAHTFG